MSTAYLRLVSASSIGGFALAASSHDASPLTTHHSPLTLRRGVTLTEALVAIFVCGIGLIALMTLFPLGALNMAQALKDDRAAHCAANASSILRSIWRVSLENGQTDQAFESALQSGVPVYLDPIGVYSFGPQLGNPPCAIPRRSLQVLDNAGPQRDSGTIRWFTLLDDLQFAKNGLPEGQPISVRREGRFSWAYMIRRLKPNDPRALEYAVVVYQNRPITLSAGYVPAGETTHQATFSPSSKTVTISYAGDRPKIRKGGWLLDASMQPEPHGHFYRAVSIRDNGPGSVVVEVQTPLRGRFNGDPAQGEVVILENVVEVFERGTLE